MAAKIKFLVPDSLSSLGIDGSASCVIAFSFCFIFPMCFPHEVPDGPSRFVLNFSNGLIRGTRTCSTTRATSYCGGTYPTVSSMIGVGDAVTTSDSTTELALEIKMTMLLAIYFGSLKL